MGGDDDPVRPRLELGERILHGVHRRGVDDEPVRREPGLVQRVKSPVEPSPRRGAARVLVDDVATRRSVHRGQHRDEIDARRGPASDGVEQLLAGGCLVRDHEDVAHTFTSSSSTTRSPLKTACRAPGTPYS